MNKSLCELFSQLPQISNYTQGGGEEEKEEEEVEEEVEEPIETDEGNPVEKKKPDLGGFKAIG